MSFLLPPTGTAAREAMGDLAHVAEVLDPRNLYRMATLPEAIARGRRTAAQTKGVKSVTLICINGTDERLLISVGPRGGWKKLWNFGTGR